MVYPTLDQILFIHQQVLMQTGGSAGLRDNALLESAIARPKATFGGEDLYPELTDKAAALFDSLIRNHPFVDGNKRVAVVAMVVFVRENGHRLIATEKEMENFALNAAQSVYTLTEIAEWIQANLS